MVVAVGLTLVEPLADVDVNVPGAMAILVAPIVAQLSVLLAPEFMAVGAAVKEVIVGAEPGPEDWLDESGLVQPDCPTRANRVSTITQSSSPKGCGHLYLSQFMQEKSADSIHSWLVAEDTSLRNAICSTLFVEPIPKAPFVIVSGRDLSHVKNGKTRDFNLCGIRFENSAFDRISSAACKTCGRHYPFIQPEGQQASALGARSNSFLSFRRWPAFHPVLCRSAFRYRSIDFVLNPWPESAR